MIKNYLTSQDVSHGRENNVHPSHQGKFYGKEVPVKNMLMIGRVVHYLAHSLVYGECQGVLLHLTLTTPVLYV